MKKHKWLSYVLLAIPAFSFGGMIKIFLKGYFPKVAAADTLLPMTGLVIAGITSLALIVLLFGHYQIKGWIEVYLTVPVLTVLLMCNTRIMDAETYLLWQNRIITFGWYAILFETVLYLISYATVFCLFRLIVIFRQNTWKKHSLIIRLVYFLVREKNLRRQVAIQLIVISVVVSAGFLICGLFVGSLSFTKWIFVLVVIGLLWMLSVGYIAVFIGRGSVIGDMEKVNDLIIRMSSGEYLQNIPVPENSYLYNSCEKLVHMGSSLEVNIKKAIASEKLKVDLITNVSHDLKTPLTSIIGYSEMLLQEEMNDTLKEYVNKLNYKARYLYEMVEDVFELSKTSSGNMIFQRSVLDIQKLLEQTLGEMNDRLLESCFVIRKQYMEDAVLVETDGARMHRVFQNLFDNVLKYSLTGSRIYLSVEAEKTLVKIIMMNTASYEMDFTPEEIIERFARGNKARSGEGSGIGLAIAKAYTEACGGSFQIKIEGDQFKTIIAFERILKA
ncbi:MAG: HAMP domain-containing sensor histidine kinase [Bacillota bacterium]|nr:HAMP domain-containing sensor histidine kinase [Bacillota bacterium]